MDSNIIEWRGKWMLQTWRPPRRVRRQISEAVSERYINDSSIPTWDMDGALSEESVDTQYVASDIEISEIRSGEAGEGRMANVDVLVAAQWSVSWFPTLRPRIRAQKYVNLLYFSYCQQVVAILHCINCLLRQTQPQWRSNKRETTRESCEARGNLMFWCSQTACRTRAKLTETHEAENHAISRKRRENALPHPPLQPIRTPDSPRDLEFL